MLAFMAGDPQGVIKDRSMVLSATGTLESKTYVSLPKLLKRH